MENKVIQNFLRHLIDKGVSTSSLKYYKSDISSFLSWAKGRKIDNKLIQEYINTERLTTPLSTINRRLSTLRSYSTFLGKDFMNGVENVTGFRKIARSWQEQIINKFEHKPKLKNLLSKVFFNRPNWYRRYHSYPLASYIHIAILILFSSISGYAVYDQVFYSTDRTLAFPTALERPNRFLSFQGRLTDDLGNPETVATNMVFKLYAVSTGGTALWDSSTCSITPDQDGIFSTLLGSSCGTEIASSVFSENADIWLGVTVGADAEATPRIQIATVAYALNSETLQGFPAGTGTSTIPYINSSGVMVLANASPKIQSTSGTFAVEGQALTITTPNTSNGIITINPDGTGTLDLTFEGAAAGGGANGFINATNANITSGSLYSGTVASNATGYNFINFLSGSSPTSKFSIQNDGDILTAGDITIGGGNINTGNIALTIGDATTDSITLTTDGTGNGEVVLPNDSVGPSEILSTGQTDEYCLTYETTGTTFEWQTCSAGGSLFTDSGAETYLTSTTDDFIIGGSTLAASIFGIDESAGNFYFGYDNSANPTFNFEATDADAGEFGFNTNDSFFFSNAMLGVGTTSPLSRLSVINNPGAGNYTGKAAFLVDQYENQDILTASASGVTKLTLQNDGTLKLHNSSSTISNDSGDISITPASGILSLTGDMYISSGLSTFGTAVSDGTIEATQFCTGDGETNCVTDFSSFGVGTITAVGSMTSGVAFGDATADNDWLGLGGSAGRIEFDDQAIDEINFLDAYLGVGTSTPNARIDSLSTTGEQLRLTYTNASVYSGFTVDSNGYLAIDPTGSRTAIDGSLQVGSGTGALAYSRFGSGTTGHGGNINAANDVLISSDLELDGNLYLDSGTIANSAGTAAIVLSSAPTTTANTLSASNWLIENTANVGQAALMVNNTKSGDLLTASASGVTKFTVQNDGDVVLSNQLQLGNLASNPTALGPGSMYFNTVTNTNQCYNGTSWFNCGGTLYSNTNASVANGSYITVAHNLATNDLLSSAWINAQGVWKDLETTYKPAIAWEGKDTQKGIYHNNINEYSSSNETSLTSSALNDGLLSDTFEDQVKTDSSNTTVSVATQTGDDGSTNYITLDQRVQSGRAGLLGGQTYNTATNDNDGQAYLGSNTVNDIYYYDRSKDSVPEVLVELGIDPNWYNGVTLSVATSSATYSQNGTLAEKNPNLTTKYNGSLIKATGTDSTPRTIYITIKSPTTFDWTNYQGDAATGVTITPGTAQALGSTGVSANFTAANYNVGDVFKIASWYIEGESATRGAKQQFPERSNIVATASSVDIIDADTQKLWIRFTAASNNLIGSPAPVTVSMLNGSLYKGGATLGLYYADFTTDSGKRRGDVTYFKYNGSISQRDSALNETAVSTTPLLVTAVVNDVAAAVIPNQPTQEVTVSGWGYINIAAADASEYVNLPYKFNDTPSVNITYSGYKTTAPNNLAECTTHDGTNVDYKVRSITNNNFLAYFETDAVAWSAYACYTWTATGTVSPKQFVVAATGNSTSGGTDIINETDGTVAHILSSAGTATASVWETKIAIASNNLYTDQNTSGSSTRLVKYQGIHGLRTEATVYQYRSGAWFGTWLPAPLGTTAASSGLITSLSVSHGTSTIDGKSDTIYVGSTSGLSVIQDKQTESYSYGNATSIHDGAEENDGSVKYYTYDSITEEMIGDVRGMWGLYNTDTDIDTAETTPDSSVKGETLSATNTNSTGFTSVTGVRGEGVTFDGTDDYFTCTDANCGGTTELDPSTSNWSVGAWVKTTRTTRQIIAAKGSSTGQFAYSLETGLTNAGAPEINFWNTIDTSYISARSSTSIADGLWHHIIGTYDGTTAAIYIDGQLSTTSTTKTGTQVTNSTGDFFIGSRAAGLYFLGSIDEAFVTATALTGGQIKNMYQVGYRALQSHGTTLGGGGADTNQQLGYISTGTSSVGAIGVDENNQYMYVGTNSTTLGALSKIQLNSDTNIKTYTSSANVPTGGTTLIDEDVNSIGVGYQLEAVGSAASGVKSMGVDDNATSTSGNFVSKTYVLPKNIGSAVLWASPVIDPNDGSNTITVKASNDGGSNYVTCTLVNTNSNPAVPEKEYACTFATADNDLKVKFEFARGSTKTNTYITQYGITWLGETGFRVEQYDTNNVRLYNFSGETQNLKLNVTGASTTQLANPWTDGGSYLYATGYEALRIYDGAGTNYLGLSHDGTLANLTYNGSTVLSINSTGDLLPNTDDTQSLGNNTKRWKDLFVGGDTMHIGTSTTDEATLAYNTTSNIFNIGTDSTTNADIAFFTDDLYLDKSAGSIGIGDVTPDATLDVAGSFQFDGNGILGDASGDTITSNANAWTFANDTDFTLTGGVNGLSFDSTTLSIDSTNNRLGLGTTTPLFQTEMYGSTQLTAALTDAGSREGILSLNGSSSSAGSGGAIVFGNNQSRTANSLGYASIKGLLIDGNNNTQGDLAFSTRNTNSATNLTERMRIASGGNIGIGATAPASMLAIGGNGISSVRVAIHGAGTTAATYGINSIDSGGASTMWVNDAGAGYLKAAAWTYGSDRRMKKNIDYSYIDNGLEKIKQLMPVSYEYLDSDVSQLGFIAQDVQTVIPEAVVTNEMSGMLGLKTDFIIPYLVKAIQEQQIQIDEIALNENGNVVLTGDSEDNYEVATSDGAVNRIGAFASATVAKLRVGIGSFNQVETKIISPVANTDLIIDLQPDDSTSPSKLAIKGADNEEVASIDALGNAEFDGTVTSNELAVNNDATISGTLYANDIESTRLSEIEDLLHEVESNQSLLASAQNWESNTATISGQFTDLIATSLQSTDLFVTGQAAISSLFISDNLTATKIDSLNTPLQIQSLAASPLEIMAGKIAIDIDGNTKFLGNVEIAGNLTVNNIIVANNIDPVATESATIVEGEINTNAVAGKATLIGETESIRINNPKVTDNSLIYVTPISSTQNKVLFVKSKGEGYFEIGFSEPLDTEVEFNWWIIELQDQGVEVVNE